MLELRPPLNRALKRQYFGVLLVAVAACVGRNQASPVVPVPPATAPALIEASLRALGASAHPAPAAFEIFMEGRSLVGNWRQAYRSNDSTPLPIPTALHYLVDPAAHRAIYEYRSPAPGDIWFNYRTMYDTAGAWQVDLMGWRQGTDIARAGAASSRASLVPLERLLPDVALRQALASPSLRLSAGGVSGSRPAITYTDAVGDSVSIQFDATTLLPAAILSRANRIELRDYRQVSGLLVPFVRILSSNGQPSTEQRVSAVNLHPDVSDARFAMLPGYSDPPAAGPARATQIAGPLYRLDALPGGYHSAFVVRDRDVAVLEAPQSPQASQAALRIIATIAPGKPVGQVFITHHHADHVGGLAPYVSAGAELVVAAGLERAIRQQLPDSLSARARFTTVSKRETFGSGASRIEAVPIPNTHVEGNTAYYIPSALALFQGDLFYIPERGAVPPAFGVSQSMARVVRGCGLKVETVIGVHGRTGSWNEVETSLRLAHLDADRASAPCP